MPQRRTRSSLRPTLRESLHRTLHRRWFIPLNRVPSCKVEGQRCPRHRSAGAAVTVARSNDRPRPPKHSGFQLRCTMNRSTKVAAEIGPASSGPACSETRRCPHAGSPAAEAPWEDRVAVRTTDFPGGPGLSPTLCRSWRFLHITQYRCTQSLASLPFRVVVRLYPTLEVSSG